MIYMADYNVSVGGAAIWLCPRSVVDRYPWHHDCRPGQLVPRADRLEADDRRTGLPQKRSVAGRQLDRSKLNRITLDTAI